MGIRVRLTHSLIYDVIIQGRWLSRKGYYYVRQMVRSLNHIQSALNMVHDSLNHIHRVRCKVMTQSHTVFCKADGSVAQSHTKCTIQGAWLNHIQRVLCKVMTQPHTEDTTWSRRLKHKGYCVNQMVRSLNQSVLYNVHDSVTYKVDYAR
jgi:K+ transporter